MSDEIKVVKDEEQEQAKEELANVEDVKLNAEKEALDLEEGISFSEVLTKEDLVKYNYYLLRNGSNYFRNIIMIILGIFLIVYPFIQKEHYWICGVGFLLVVFCIFFYIPLQKALIRRQIKKKDIDQFVIDVKFASKIKYQLVGEKASPLVDYQNIYKVRQTNEYIYLHMSVYAVIIIKLDACSEREQLIEFIKNKYVGTKKYKEMNIRARH